MSRSRLILKNSGVALSAQLITAIFHFISRSFFIKYIGVEFLGLNSTFQSVLNTLSLAELGFQSAVVYNLYQPLRNKDQEMINKLMSIYKFIYQSLGVFFLVAGLLCCPVLNLVLSDIEITSSTYMFFMLSVTNAAATYLLSYKRALMYANQESYIYQTIDMGLYIVFSFANISLMYLYGNYYCYLIILIIQTVIQNIAVQIYCSRKYPFLKKVKVDFGLLKKIIVNVKDIFLGKISSYVYKSTDNLVISSIISTVAVGYLGNYTTITSQIKGIVNSILNPLAPIIGNSLAAGNDRVKDEQEFRTFTYVRYLIASVVIVPTVVLIDIFIEMWLGSAFLLPKHITWFIAIDMYISFVYGACYDYTNGKGLFAVEKKIMLFGAVLNLVSSIILAKVIGLPGVLVGTIITQCYFWISRSYIAYKHVFGEIGVAYTKYWLGNIFGVAVVLLSYFVCNSLINLLYGWVNGKVLAQFLIGGVTSILVTTVTHCIFYCKSIYFHNLLCILIRILRKQ